MKKITIVNGWHDLNSGDSAIIISIIKQILSKEKDNPEINIISELSNENEFFNGSIDYIKSSFPFLHINLIGSPFYKVYSRKSIKELFSLIKNYFLLSLPNIIFILLTKNNEYYKTLNESDIILSKGGHFIFDRKGLKGVIHLFKCLYPLKVSKKMKKNYYIISQSIGPLYNNSKNIFSRISFLMCKNILKHASKISVREIVSYENLVKLNLADNVVNTSDYAFVMKKIDDSKLSKELRLIAKKSYVVITLRQHNFHDNYGEKEYIETIIKIANHIVSKYSYDVVFVAHVKGPNSFEDDRIIINKVKERCKNDRFKFVLNQYSPQELSCFYSKAKMLIGTRFHSVIFSLTNDVPAIAISYSGYKANIMKQFELDNFMYDIESIKMDNYDNICHSVDDILLNNEKYREIIKKHKLNVINNIDNDEALNMALAISNKEV